LGFGVLFISDVSFVVVFGTDDWGGETCGNNQHACVMTVDNEGPLIDFG
jgi:hypothetical protein